MIIECQPSWWLAKSLRIVVADSNSPGGVAKRRMEPVFAATQGLMMVIVESKRRSAPRKTKRQFALEQLNSC
jgi:hypothetical protein